MQHCTEIAGWHREKGALLAAGAPAQAVEVLATAAPHYSAVAALPQRATLPLAPMPELPEPDVFAMMLLGLVLVGYRASRDSNATLK